MLFHTEETKKDVRPHQQRPFTENTNGAGEGEDLYLSVGTRRRTTTGDDELGAGSEQSYRTAQPEEETGRRGEERRKQKGEMGRKSPR